MNAGDEKQDNAVIGTVLHYGDQVTRRDIVCRTTPFGIHVIIPNISGTGRLIDAPVWARPLLMTIEILINLPLLALSLIAGDLLWIRIFRFRPAVEVELTVRELIVTDRRGNSPIPRIHRWPRTEIGEFRPNRFSLSMWVRVPGKEVCDVLGGLEQGLLDYIGEHVTPLLQRVSTNHATL